MKQSALAIGGGFLLAIPAASPEFKNHNNFFGNNRWQQTSIASGVVTYETGKPLSILTIQAKGTKATAITAAAGRFSFDLPTLSTPVGKPLVFTTNNCLLPFLQSELDNNPNPVQNPGY